MSKAFNTSPGDNVEDSKLTREQFDEKLINNHLDYYQVNHFLGRGKWKRQRVDSFEEAERLAEELTPAKRKGIIYAICTYNGFPHTIQIGGTSAKRRI